MKRAVILTTFLLISSVITSFSQPGGRDPGAAVSIGDQLNSEIKEFGSGERKNSIANASDRLGKMFGTYKSAKEFYEANESMSKGECAPDFSVNPQAAIPSTCAEFVSKPFAGTDTPRNIEPSPCATCFEIAYKKLADVRKRLSKLKCLGQSTKAYVSAATAFGDNVSSVHAIQGLAWQKERKGIMDSYTKFKTAYDAKYKELMGVLLDAMNEISECEAKTGNPDWFQRYGFMYVEFMAEKYKRVD